MYKPTIEANDDNNEPEPLSGLPEPDYNDHLELKQVFYSDIGIFAVYLNYYNGHGIITHIQLTIDDSITNPSNKLYLNDCRVQELRGHVTSYYEWFDESLRNASAIYMFIYQGDYETLYEIKLGASYGFYDLLDEGLINSTLPIIPI